MRIAAFIPIKGHSERVPNKNTRNLGGMPLYSHILKAARDSLVFDDIYVDTDDLDIGVGAKRYGAKLLERAEGLAEDWANGNDLIANHADRMPDVNIYVQLFATAPLLSPESIRCCVMRLAGHDEYDSAFTATHEPGWFWFGGQPVNFRPGILPRSQDAQTLIKESTGLYAIKRSALQRYRCRVGATPYIHYIPANEAVDLDTEEDFKKAERLLAERERQP